MAAVPLLVPPLLFLGADRRDDGRHTRGFEYSRVADFARSEATLRTWSAVVDAFGSPSSFAGPRRRAGPSRRASCGWMQGGAVASGPIVRDRLGVLLSAAWNRSSQFDRGRAIAGDAGSSSVFSHLLFTHARDELSTVVWLQKIRYPSTGPRSVCRSSLIRPRHERTRAIELGASGRNARLLACLRRVLLRARGMLPSQWMGPQRSSGSSTALSRSWWRDGGGVEHRWTLGLRFSGDKFGVGATRNGVRAGLETGGSAG